MTSTDQAFLRHTLATLAYRGGKAMRGAPEGFSTFRAGDSSRSAGEILAHIGDLFDWALHLVHGEHAWTETPPAGWDADVARFFTALRRLDDALAATTMKCPAEKLFQGPIADAFTHIGQIALLRRLAGSPVKGENFFKVEITVGQLE